MSRSWNWLRLAAGVLVILLGIAAFVWPSATLRVVGLLFGLHLLLAGATRTALMLVSSGVPVLHRILGVLFGVLVAVIGLFCLRNLTGSLALLLVVVAIGWILDGLAEIFAAVGHREPGGGWRIALGLAVTLGAVAVLVWPGLGLAGFLLIGATMLVFAGICLVLGAVAGLRSPSA